MSHPTRGFQGVLSHNTLPTVLCSNPLRSEKAREGQTRLSQEVHPLPWGESINIVLLRHYYSTTTVLLLLVLLLLILLLLLLLLLQYNCIVPFLDSAVFRFVPLATDRAHERPNLHLLQLKNAISKQIDPWW